MQFVIGPPLQRHQDACSSGWRKAAQPERLPGPCRIFDAATICMALVICAVLRIDLIRRRMSCVFAIAKFLRRAR